MAAVWFELGKVQALFILGHWNDLSCTATQIGLLNQNHRGPAGDIVMSSDCDAIGLSINQLINWYVMTTKNKSTMTATVDVFLVVVD